MPTARRERTRQLSASYDQSMFLYGFLWKGSVAVLLPFFALLCGWYKPWKLLLPFQPEEHPPKLSMIPLLVTLTAVTRVARRFFVN